MKLFLKSTCLAALAAATLSPVLAQQEIGYIEEFALAADRNEALRQLIPGTEDYYYYHALHFQSTGQAKEYAAILSQWEKRFQNSGLRDQVKHRQILLNYSDNPKQALEELRRELGINFNHQQEGKAKATQYPSKLDPKEISWESLLNEALSNNCNLDLLTEDAFFPLLKFGRKLTVEQRRNLLSRASLPDLPGLVELIAEDLKSKESRGFGEFNIHRALTITQLDELQALIPTLTRNENFVHTRLARLLPGADSNAAVDPAVREAYLERAWKFVSPLEPSFNSLKVHLLYQRLVHDRAQGVMDPTRFLTYLKLPRNVFYIRPEWKRDEERVWKHAANVGADYREVTGFPPIGGDDALVRDYLLHLLKDAKNFDPYAPYIAESWLKAVFAESKIVNGVGKPEEWASLLSPSAYQTLKDRVDVDFDPAQGAGKPSANALQLGVEDPVHLRLHVKNVDKLLVKVFEVNTFNYYREHGREVSTDLLLDGLVANHERSFEYDEAPVRRVARDFEFPEIGKRRGVWVIEFIGGSRSSRAIIRKGQLSAFATTGAGGSKLQLLDASLQPVRNGAVWLGDRRFAGDEDGHVVIPFSNNPGQRLLVIKDASGFSSLAPFDHPAEQYQLDAGLHVAREALRPGALATLALRPTLTVAGEAISLKRLRDVRLVLTSTDLDGVSSTVKIPNFDLQSDREATHEFRVPDRLAALNVSLFARIVVTSNSNQEIELSDSTSLQVNGQLRTDGVDDLYLSCIDGAYVIELLGRSGEISTGRNLNVQFHRPEFTNSHNVTLKTDAAGGVELGALDGIDLITATTPDGLTRSWPLTHARRSQVGEIHVVAGDPVRIPYVGTLERSEVAFLATSRGGTTADFFGSLQLQDGFLTAAKLPAGDYRLYLKESHDTLSIRVAAGETSAGYVFNTARTLELDTRPPAYLVSATADKKTLEISVANADALTRVHLIATRFLPDYDIFADLGHVPTPGLYSGSPAQLPNLYLSGRKIGDEFRYILERRYGKKLPGNMLERPEILLNPWAVRDTEAGIETLSENEKYRRKPAGSIAAGGRSGSEKKRDAGGEDSSPRTIDFLAHAPAQLLNLRPDKDGRLSIDLAAFGDRQHIHILVVDPAGESYEELSLPDRETAIRDLRLLANALNPIKHFTEQDSVTLMKAGDKLVIPDLLTGRFETFDHLGAAYRYFLALRDDATLREFGFITNWDSLKPDEKRAKYSEFACHELSFFLAMKDPEFFKAVVAPHLANKKDRTFLDDSLLDRDLSGYFAPFAYNRLNVPERILLARRHPARADGIRHDLRDRLALTPPDLGRDSFLFDSALSASGLSSERNIDRDRVAAVAAGLKARGGEESGMAALADAAPAPAAPEMAKNLSRRKTSNAAAKDEKKSDGRMPGEKQKVLEESAARYRIAADKDGVDAFGTDLGPGLVETEVLYRALATTKEWAENNYYHLPIGQHTYSLITENKFWLDFARHKGDEGFGSRHLGEASRSFHEAMMALAVLDLPFTAPEHETKIDGTSLTFTAAGPVIAFHREIKEAKLAENRPPLLVSQAFYLHNDRYLVENGEKTDKFVTDEFLVGIVYGGQVVVTNPTSSRQKLDVLLQIPKGSIPVLGHRATATQRVAMEPYTTQRFEVQFYFPLPGEFPTYPAHVSKTGEVVAHAGPFIFKVVDKLTKVDESSWAYISQWGTPEQVLDYLATRNLHAIDLEKIAWRCREDAKFMKKSLAALDLRGIYHGTLYSYGIMHNNTPAVRQFLLMQGHFLNSCGLYLDSKLVTIDPIARRAYQHLEYKPLVNNRAHKVGEDRKILNDRIRGQYQQFMQVLSQKRALDDEDRLSTVYYLFLQDRAEEALALLAKVDAKKLPTRLQYDYFQAYAAFYQEDPATARKIASGYADYPVDRWRERFANVIGQADEIEGQSPEVIDNENRDQLQAQEAAKQSSLALKVEGTTVKLDYRNLAEVTVNYYEMDLEFLFSTNPFVSSGGGGFSIVRPNQSATIKLPKGKNAHSFALPADYQAKNVLVEVLGGGKKRSQAVYANELRTDLSENFGILSVRHAKDDKPLSKVYVKVYALTGDGPKFYKDGYTDLRGKFDYTSVSTSDIGAVQKFSILIMSENQGATVLEAAAPQR
jgi:hypothetical protein